VTRLCRLEELEATGAKGVTLANGREIVVVASAGSAKAYVNACPHQGIPLETFPDRFLTPKRDLLICTGHGALFRVEDGLCVAGPCNGARLRSVPVDIREGQVMLGDGA
jgi:nitrite reductase/ring-hydroxylating ferredoxin subunit